jgi:hypothetical protein
VNWKGAGADVARVARKTLRIVDAVMFVDVSTFESSRCYIPSYASAEFLTMLHNGQLGVTAAMVCYIFSRAS